MLYFAIILEALKLYIYILQISNLEDETDIRKIIRNDMYLQNLLCILDFPIEIHNLLDYIKKVNRIRNIQKLFVKKILFDGTK